MSYDLRVVIRYYMLQPKRETVGRRFSNHEHEKEVRRQRSVGDDTSFDGVL